MQKEKYHIQTPAILLDLNIMESNLSKFQQMADVSIKQFWPMVKTHKSTEIARMQHNYGATGFLCGTLDECEALALCGIKNIMYAYPVMNEPNISRAIALAKNCNFILRIDHFKQAEVLNKAAKLADTCANYVVIINSGLNRLGIEPCHVGDFVKALTHMKNIRFKGISTHPGHAYEGKEAVLKAAKDESDKMAQACTALHNIGFMPELVSTGSTPTFPHVIDDAVINMLHPGNYVFMDNLQISLGCAKESECALSVFATVISARKDENGNDIFIIDAGTKCFGDQGVHAAGAISEKYGRIKNYPGLELYNLSEEVGRIRAGGNNCIGIKLGDKIEIIPNHSCSVANMTGWYIGTRAERIDSLISVDIRGNSTKKLPHFR